VKNGSVVDLSKITVTSDEEFYAIFKLVDDIRTIIHPEWFNYSLTEYSDSNYMDNENYHISGYSIEPKVSLRGKVVIPREYNGSPVIEIKNF
jgi:hypothetical protein